MPHDVYRKAWRFTAVVFFTEPDICQTAQRLPIKCILHVRSQWILQHFMETSPHPLSNLTVVKKRDVRPYRPTSPDFKPPSFVNGVVYLKCLYILDVSTIGTSSPNLVQIGLCSFERRPWKRQKGFRVNNSAADWSILLQFSTEFDHATDEVPHSRSRGQWYRSQREVTTSKFRSLNYQKTQPRIVLLKFTMATWHPAYY